MTSSTIVFHLVRSYNQRVLVCAPSNVAADNLSRARETVSSLVEKFCLHNMAPLAGGSRGELYRLNKLCQVCCSQRR